MDRHQARINALVCVYQNLLVDCPIEKSIEEFKKMQNDSFFEIVTKQAVLNKQRYIAQIDNLLMGYTFDRLGFIEKALLLMACSEFENKTAPVPVIIDEYILLAKQYCDDKSYRFINTILDKYQSTLND